MPMTHLALDWCHLDNGGDVPLTEPVVIQDLFCTGGDLEIGSGVIRFVGWTYCPELGERRIVVRLTLPVAKARELAGKVIQDMHKRAS